MSLKTRKKRIYKKKVQNNNLKAQVNQQKMKKRYQMMNNLLKSLIICFNSDQLFVGSG